MNDTGDIREIVKNRESVIESLADVEGNREIEVKSELEHSLKKADLGGAVDWLVVVIEADFTDGDEFFRRLRGGLATNGVNWVAIGVFRVDAVGAEDIFVGVGEGLGVAGIFGIGANNDNLVNTGGVSVDEELLGLLGREPLLVVEMTMRIDKIG